jgi:hypothetical protein
MFGRGSLGREGGRLVGDGGGGGGGRVDMVLL